MIEISRVGTAPILHQSMHSSLGDNINGPSLVRVPDGVQNALGRYYLYFSHHKGQHIRLAYADDLAGPWSIHAPGVMLLSHSPFAQTRPDAPQPAWATAQDTDGLYPHLASPDVRILQDGSFEMYVHGLDASGDQVTWQATSLDGLSWSYCGQAIPDTYLRLFDWQGATYAMARCSRIWRDTATGWQAGGIAISESVRHVAVILRGSDLHVLFTRIGDAPEVMLHTTLDLERDWRAWSSAGEPVEVMRAEIPWEGLDEPITPSLVGAVDFSNALRDPCLFEDDGKVWLVYAGGGEHALGLARVDGF